ncbi:MAG: glycosyltransferase family 2 protein [Kiritimatiellia bacterium]
MTKPLVSIIIVNWNKVEYLRNCIESLLESTYKSIEIIVVDNGSADGSAEYLKHLIQTQKNVKAIFNKENLGFAGPSNQGAEIADGELLFLLNNDTIIDRNCIEEVVIFFNEHPEASVVQPRLMQNEELMDEQGNVLLTNGFLLHFGYNCILKPVFKATYPVFSVKGAAFFIRREVYTQIGLFRPEFFAFYEETDFCHRCWLAGFPVYYMGKAVVMHIGHITAAQFKKEKPVWIWEKSIYNRFVSLATLLSAKSLMRIFVPHLLLSLLTAPILHIKGRKNIAKATISALCSFIKNIRHIQRQRQCIHKQLDGYSEKQIFDELGLITRPPKGYLWASAKGNLSEYWKKPQTEKYINDLIAKLSKNSKHL